MDNWTRAFLLENLNNIMKRNSIARDLHSVKYHQRVVQRKMPTDDWIAYEESEYDCDDPDDYMSEADE